MKLTIRTMLEAKSALYWLGNEKLPIKTAYWIQKNIQHINSELRVFDEMRIKLVKETSNGKDSVPPEKMSKFTEEMTALSEEEAEVDIKLIPFDQLPKDISPLNMMALDFMIDYSGIENPENIGK